MRLYAKNASMDTISMSINVFVFVLLKLILSSIGHKLSRILQLIMKLKYLLQRIRVFLVQMGVKDV